MHFNKNSKETVHETLDDLGVSDIKNIKYHPDYDSITHIGDIALLKLENRQYFNRDINRMTYDSLQQIIKYIKNSNDPNNKMKIGVFTWDPNVSTRNFKFEEDNTSYFDEDLVNCPFQSQSS